MTQDIGLEIKINKIKMKFAVTACIESKNHPIGKTNANEGTKEISPEFSSHKMNIESDRKHKTKDRKFLLFAIPYVIGSALYLALIGLHIFEWSWKAKSAIFLSSSAFAFVATLCKGLLTNWDKSITKFSQKGVDELKSLCDGISTVFGLIAILSAFSSTISSHEVSDKVDKLQHSQDETKMSVCEIYAELKKPCKLPVTMAKK